MITKEKAFSTFIFSIFLIGSTIIWYSVGRTVAIGVALEVLAVYLLIKLEITSILEKNIKERK